MVGKEMKVQILSDLHVDFKENFDYFTGRCQPRADILVSAGDLCPFNDPVRQTYIETRFLPKWKHTVLIPGNHEFYGDSFTSEWFGSKSKTYESDGHKVYSANNTVLEIEGIYFVCSTLWSHIGYEKASEIQWAMNDYRMINGLTVDEVNRYHRDNVRFLEEAMEQIPDGKRCIIVTHHVPSFNLISDRWKGNTLNDAFAADMDTFIMINTDKISHWIHGHSHDYCNERIMNTQFIRNPMGYPQERGCDMDLVITV
jgi:Icc-related predicted phosphoesterase